MREIRCTKCGWYHADWHVSCVNCGELLRAAYGGAKALALDVARLTRERDEARAQVDKAEKQAAYNAAVAASLADQVNELLAEFKDQLRWLDKGSERYNRVVALIAKAEEYPNEKA